MHSHLYVTYWYYDIILHFLGGVSIALSTFCITELFEIKIIKNNYWSLIPITLFAGIAWEFFEVYYDIAGYVFGTIAYNLDTVKDILNDIFGSVFVWLIIRNKK